MTAKAATVLSKNFFVAENVKPNETKRVSWISLSHKSKRVLSVFSLIFAFLTLALAIVALFSYWHYERIVEERLANGFWETRSGIYAAPRTLQVGQKLSAEELAALLRRTGYVENAESDVWNGSFTVNENTVLIRQGSAFQTQPATTVSFNRNGRIASLKENGVVTLENFKLKPELLTDESGAKSNSRRTLGYQDLPKPLINAILAIEDHRFHEHQGVDVKAMFRALWANVTGGEMKQGGSTITQQLVKNTFLTAEKTLHRKFAEGFIALALERRLSKEAIFALYCNEIYLGQRGAVAINGVEQAARVYFGKPIEKLTLNETAIIAAMIKSPGRFSPDTNREALIERRNLVLSNMAQYGFISREEAESAKHEEIALTPLDNSTKPFSAHFVDSVKEQLDGNTDMNGWRVHTTIDAQLEEFARNAVNKHLEKLSRKYSNKNLQAALVAIDPKTGNVLAMVGGRDYAVSQLNRSTDTFRQPGSTFKPIVYAAALEGGKSPAARYSDSPAEFIYAGGEKYKPKNYGGGFSMQPVTMKTALVKSLNTVTVGIAMETGLSKISQYAKLFGVPVKDVYPSMALGTEEVSPLEIASAYTAFANGGVRTEPKFVAEIIGGNGNRIYETKPKQIKVTSPETAYVITDMLTDAVNHGTARSAKNALGNQVFAGKTGTANDGWFVGYTPNLVCAVWVGFDENKDLNLTGADSALPLWVDFMKAAIDARPEFGGKDFAAPKSLIKLAIDPETGMLAGASCPHRETVVLPKSVAPNTECLLHDHRYNQPQEYEMPVETMVATVVSPQLPEQNEPVKPREVQAETVIARRETEYKSDAPLKIVEITRSKAQSKRAPQFSNETENDF